MLKLVQVLVLAVLCSSTQGMYMDILYIYIYIYTKIKPSYTVIFVYIRQTSSS